MFITYKKHFTPFGIISQQFYTKFVKFFCNVLERLI
nr:MAG TPA: hypothetical protein [Caudoviricetes sp.]